MRVAAGRLTIPPSSTVVPAISHTSKSAAKMRGADAVRGNERHWNPEVMTGEEMEDIIGIR